MREELEKGFVGALEAQFEASLGALFTKTAITCEL
jgi:hypothetical protein